MMKEINASSFMQEADKYVNQATLAFLLKRGYDAVGDMDSILGEAIALYGADKNATDEEIQKLEELFGVAKATQVERETGGMKL
jgi:hypothetical protein